MKYLAALIASVTLSSCQSVVKPQGDTAVIVFDDSQLYFNAAIKKSTSHEAIMRLDAGRVLIKKVKLPRYELQTQVTVSVSLRSNGDPWDKSGSLFIIPKSQGANLLDFESGKLDLNTLNQQYPAVVASKSESFIYAPNLELLRFMTPFGVGFFNDHERTKDRKPPYIPHWEDEVVWSENITHLLSELEEEVYIGVYIDTWDNNGYRISAQLDFTESTFEKQFKKTTKVIPLINTVKYAAGQKHYDGFSQGDLAVDFNLPENAINSKLYYITTGHGGHATGDEFVKRENIIRLNGEVIKQYVPWRDDCASFRRFNPSSGTWRAKDIIPGSISLERIASSDLSRSNWCPGSNVKPSVIPLSSISSGQNSLSISIPEAQIAKENEYNYWMVSSYITYEVE